MAVIIFAYFFSFHHVYLKNKPININDMTQIQKQILFWAGLAIAAIIGAFLIVAINQKLNTATSTNTVSFSGEGKILAKPDVALVNVTVLTEAVTSQIAQTDNTKKSNAVIDFLKKQNIEEKDIKTVGYNIYPKYRYYPSRNPEIKGYEVNNTIEVKIRDLEKVSDILDGVVKAGANQIGNLSFQIDEPEKLKTEARKKAIEEAEKKAGELETELDIKLGRIINFMENVGGMPMPYYEYNMKAMSSTGGIGGGGGPDVQTGENEIIVDVTLTYQIK